MAENVEKSEFGKGLAYCLGLFLCHSERDYGKRETEYRQDVGMWFYGAADHICEMEVPESLKEPLRDRVSAFRELVIMWRLPMSGQLKPSEKDKTWAIKEAKEILRLIDENFGIATAEASWD